jgi:hypothetical protein
MDRESAAASQLGEKSAIELNADKESKPKERIAFIIYMYGLGNSPSIINAARMLVKNGYLVDIFTYNTFLGDIEFDEPRIQIYEIAFRDKRHCATCVLSKLRRAVYWKIRAFLRLLPWKIQVNNREKSIEGVIYSFVKSCGSIMGATTYRCFIGVEPFGMMAAYQLGLSKDTPFIYYNMELHLDSDSRTVEEIVIKKVEKKLNKYAAFTISQDNERSRLIAEENEIQESSVIPVPAGAEGEPFRGKTSFLRERLGLAEDKRIIVYAGFITDWAMCVEIAKNAQSWPEKWVMVFHTHGYNDASYIKKVRSFECSNVRFSMSPVPYDELSALLASADIGIALYRDLGANFTLIRSASGKLAHYLKSGLPVVVNSYPDISQVVDKYHCGIAIDSPSQLREAIDKILRNYERMRFGAYLCYEENYRFAQHFAKVVDRIGRL